jgi:hypothetical protein
MKMQHEKYATWDGAEYGIHVGLHTENGGVKGWFEIYDVDSGGEDFYAEGGLWFEEDGLTLCDYDGVYELPKPVCELLYELGYNTSYAWEVSYNNPVERNEHGDEFVVGCAKCGNDVYEVNERGLCNECVNL